MAISQNLGGTGGTGASMMVLHLAAIMPTVRPATLLACLSRGGVGSMRYPNSPTHCVNSADRYGFSASTLMYQSIGFSMSIPVRHSGWPSNRRVICSHSSVAPRSRMKTGYIRRVVRSVSRSQYLNLPQLFSVCVYASWCGRWCPVDSKVVL